MATFYIYGIFIFFTHDFMRQIGQLLRVKRTFNTQSMYKQKIYIFFFIKGSAAQEEDLHSTKAIR